LVRETRLEPAQFILPLFVCPGGRRAPRNRRHARELPDVHRPARRGVRRGAVAGIGGVILFGLPESKDDMATGACDENGIVQRAIRAIRKETPKLLVVTDVCNCEYTSHGHCGYVKDGDVDNDTTLNGWPNPRYPMRAPGPTWWRRPT